MDNHHLRGLILKLEYRLSDHDRIRLHFFLGDDVPRRIRDDPSLAGTLNLMQSLFDQDIINEQDFTFLINAFDQIQCLDAAQLLRDHMGQIQLNQSMQSLTTIMPSITGQPVEDEDDEVDKYTTLTTLRNDRPMTTIVNDQLNPTNRLHISSRYLVIFFILSLIVGLGILITLNFIRFHRINKEILIKDQIIYDEQRKNNQTIKVLKSLQLLHNQTAQSLSNELIRSSQEQAKNNQTIEQLNDDRAKHIKTIHNSEDRLRKLVEELMRLKTEKVSAVKGKQVDANVTIGSQTTTTTTTESGSVPALLDSAFIGPKTTWIPNGITVAGNQDVNYDAREVLHPFGIDVDDDRTVIIADNLNDQIVEWKPGAMRGQIVVGRKEQGDPNDQLNYPTDVIIDKHLDALIICDKQNRRVVQWFRRKETSREIIISNVTCFGLAMDNQRSLYVSDLQKHEVRRWRLGDTQGTLVAGGNGSGHRFDQLNSPHYIVVDSNYSVYVSDSYNHRVMKWTKDAKEGILVAGGQGVGNDLSQVSGPEGLFVDRFESIYVADCKNHRIMRWLKGATKGTVVVGTNDRGRRTNQFNCPRGLSFDLDNNLYVADSHNHRIQKFDVVRHSLE